MELLFYIYLSCFVVGGAVVIMSALGGAGGEVGVEVEATELGEGVQFLSFLSVRKVFFFLCFFGLMGLGRLVMGTVATLVTSVAVGGVCAWLGDFALRALSGSNPSSAAEPRDYVGLEAVVTVPIAEGARGKISCVVKGRTTELLARLPEGAAAAPEGARMLVLEMEDGEALVEQVT